MSATEKIGNLIDHEITSRDCTHCFAVPGGNSMIDLVHPITGKTVIYGKTLEDCRQEKGYENAELILVEDFCKAKADKQDAPVTWNETTEDKYHEMLNILPPACWTGDYFLVGEPWDHHAVTGRARYAAFGWNRETDRYVESSRPMTIKELKEFLNA